MKAAAIDLGSNTFHLLIVEGEKKYSKRVVPTAHFVGLGDGGIEWLSEEAIERGLEACLAFRKMMNASGVDRLKVTGTAALRTAANAREFTARAEAILGIKIDVIDGNEEARYIFEGVRQLSALVAPTIIVDIGEEVQKSSLQKMARWFGPRVMCWCRSDACGLSSLRTYWN